MTKKRGPLSLDDRAFILKHKDDLSIQEIANELGRSAATIKNFLVQNDAYHQESAKLDEREDAVLRAKLHKKPYWKEVVAQLGEGTEELIFFENMWVALVSQFKENVLIAEELDIKQWITLEILNNRCMRNRRKAVETESALEMELAEELAKEKEERDHLKVGNLRMSLENVRSASTGYTNEQAKLMERIEKIRKDLNLARANRVKIIEDGRTSFTGLLKMLEDEDMREKMGEEAELMNRAAQKAKLKLGELHTFMDGKVDRPLLSSDTVAYGSEEEVEDEDEEVDTLFTPYDEDIEGDEDEYDDEEESVDNGD